MNHNCSCFIYGLLSPLPAPRSICLSKAEVPLGVEQWNFTSFTVFISTQIPPNWHTILVRTDCGASQSEVQPRTESSSTKLDTLLLLLWGSAGTASIGRKQVFVHLDLTLFRPQHLLRSLGFLQLSSFLLRRSVGFSLTINMKLTSYKNGEDRWGPAVAQAALQLLFLFPGSFLTTFPLCPHHTCSGLQLFLRIWIIHLKVRPFPPQLHAPGPLLMLQFSLMSIIF